MFSTEEEAMNQMGFSVLADASCEEIQSCKTIDDLLRVFYSHGAYIEHNS